MKTELIINLKEGVLPEDVLPASPLEGASENISIERVHDIKPHINSLLSEEGRNSLESAPSESNAESIFQSEVYPNLEGVQKKLYRSFKIQIPKSTSPEDLEALINTLEADKRVEYVQHNQVVTGKQKCAENGK